MQRDQKRAAVFVFVLTSLAVPLLHAQSATHPMLPAPKSEAVQLSQKPSFDCKAAATAWQKQVCTFPLLAAIDRRIAARLQEAHSILTPESASLAEADQRAFTAHLDALCALATAAKSDDDPQCLAAAMDARLRDLRLFPVGGGGVLFQVGSGPKTGLRIDRPNQAQQQWLTLYNSYMAKAARADQAAMARAKQDPNLGGDKNAYEASTSARIAAANERLISVDELNDGYFGGAHGHLASKHWNYWLDSGRNLTAADIFRPDAAWKPLLAVQLLRVLHKPSQEEGLLWDESGLRKGVQGGLTPDRWTPTRFGLVVTFQEYEVAAYVAGISTVVVSWDHLKSVLQPGLHPETLPDAASDQQ